MGHFLFLWILYSFSGFGQGVHRPSFAMRLLGQGLQCLWYLSGTKPLGHFLHKPWKSTFSSTWHFEQEFLKPFGKEPSAHVWHWPLLLTMSFRYGHGSHVLRSGLDVYAMNLLNLYFYHFCQSKISWFTARSNSTHGKGTLWHFQKSVASKLFKNWYQYHL